MVPKFRPPHQLAPHVHACRSGSHVILLDLKRGHYLGVDGKDADALRLLVSGLPNGTERLPTATEASLGFESQNAHALEVFNEMRAARMLSEEGTSNRNLETETVEIPQVSLIEGYSEIKVDISARDVARYATAALSAALLLKWFSLASIATHIRRRRSSSASALNLGDARRHVATLRRVRPFLYTAQDACLFHSLATLEYLSYYQIVPKLVFGVTSQPFRAHCWLQHGGIVIDDVPEYVQEYTPISVW